MSGGRYPYETMRNDFGNLALPNWEDLPVELQELWTTGPIEGVDGAVRYPGTETLAWASARVGAGQ